MPREIKNPLEEGIPSKIYFIAYGKPLSGYEIAKRTQKIKPPHAPQTAKVYQWLKKLVDNGHMVKLEEGYFSKAESLLSQIEKKISTKLSENEKRGLLKVLDSEEFRSLLEDQYEKYDFRKNINASETILVILCMLMSVCLSSRVFLEENEKTVEFLKEGSNKPEAKKIINKYCSLLNIKEKIPEGLAFLCVESVDSKLMEKISKIHIIGSILISVTKVIDRLIQKPS